MFASGTEGFSVAMGLFDLLLPILYLIYAVLTFRFLHKRTNTVLLAVFIAGAAVSVASALIPPTIKICVGLGMFEFEEPIYAVTVNNFCLLISAVAFFLTTFRFSNSTYLPSIALPAMAIAASSSVNGNLKTAAIIAGAIGIILADVTLIIIQKRAKLILPMVFAVLSIFLVFGIGISGMLLDGTSANSHWIMESINCANILCLLLSAYFTYKGCEKENNTSA